MISIVVAGKNDNYGGYFDERLILTLKYNIKQFRKYGFDTEIVFVEWNPIPDKPLLSSKLVKMFDNIRCYVVSKEMHDKIAGPYEYMTFLEFFAKNVGIRRAKGDYIIATNADVFYGKDFFENLSANPLDKNTIYRAERNDIRFGQLEELSEKEFSKRTFRKNILYGKPYVDAAGDFTMASKELFEKINGYDEKQRFVKIHKDSRILFSAMVQEDIKFSLLGKIYHIDHEGSAVGTTGQLTNYRATNGPYSWKYVLGLPYQNKPFWGMTEDIVDEIEIEKDIINIVFKQDFDLEDYSFEDEKYQINQDKMSHKEILDYKQQYINFERYILKYAKDHEDEV